MTHQEQTNIGVEQGLAAATVSSRGRLIGKEQKMFKCLWNYTIGQCDGR